MRVSYWCVQTLGKFIMNKQLDIQITDQNSLFDACDYLHDAEFTRQDVIQTGLSELSIVCERDVMENPDLVVRTRTLIPGFFRVS